MKKRDWLIFVVLIILILVIIFSFCVLKNDKTKENNFQNLNIDIQNFQLENRAMLFNNNELLIGENQKELQNGYYDVKVLKVSNGLMVYLNKLWYEKHEEDNIHEEYLAKICRELVKCLNVQSENEEIEYQLYKYIKENYLDIRNGENKDKIKVDKVIIDSTSIDNQCVINIKVE